jgi:hypothetical protein
LPSTAPTAPFSGAELHHCPQGIDFAEHQHNRCNRCDRCTASTRQRRAPATDTRHGLRAGGKSPLYVHRRHYSRQRGAVRQPQLRSQPCRTCRPHRIPGAADRYVMPSIPCKQHLPCDPMRECSLVQRSDINQGLGNPLEARWGFDGDSCGPTPAPGSNRTDSAAGVRS